MCSLNSVQSYQEKHRLLGFVSFSDIPVSVLLLAVICRYLDLSSLLDAEKNFL